VCGLAPEEHSETRGDSAASIWSSEKLGRRASMAVIDGDHGFNATVHDQMPIRALEVRKLTVN
jgi:hypothetical protein